MHIYHHCLPAHASAPHWNFLILLWWDVHWKTSGGTGVQPVPPGASCGLSQEAAPPPVSDEAAAAPVPPTIVSGSSGTAFGGGGTTVGGSRLGGGGGGGSSGATG